MALEVHSVCEDFVALYDLVYSNLYCLNLFSSYAFSIIIIAVGCPIIHMKADAVDFHIPFRPCPTNITGCPQKGHPTYYTDQLYLCTYTIVSRNLFWFHENVLGPN